MTIRKGNDDIFVKFSFFSLHQKYFEELMNIYVTKINNDTRIKLARIRFSEEYLQIKIDV